MLGWFKVGDGAGFALEPFAESFRGNLDSNIAAEARVARAVDVAHAGLWAPGLRKDRVSRLPKETSCQTSVAQLGDALRAVTAGAQTEGAGSAQTADRVGFPCHRADQERETRCVRQRRSESIGRLLLERLVRIPPVKSRHGIFIGRRSGFGISVAKSPSRHERGSG